MKRILNLRKRVVVISIFLGLLFSASSFTIGSVGDSPLFDNKPQKKVQRVKVIVSQDGKETRIDTAFNLVDETAIQIQVDSILKKFDAEGIGSGKSDIIIHRDGKTMHWKNRNGDRVTGDEQFDIMIQSGDSGKTKQEQRVIRLGKDCCYYSFGGHDGKKMVFPQMPPMPPHCEMLINRRFDGDPYAFDTKDESVVSYEKKDIGNGLERITIVRKKKPEQKEEREVRVRVETSDDSKK